MSEVPDEQSTTGYLCPHCQELVPGGGGESSREIQCPHCGGMVLLPAADGTFAAPSEEEGERLLRPALRDDELDGLKIRNIAVGRRALIRARTYALVAVLGCLFAVVKGALAAGALVRARGWGLRAGLYLLIAVAAGMGIGYFGRRLYRLHRELTRPPAPDPNLPAPDFTELSDGSQRWENLDRM